MYTNLYRLNDTHRQQTLCFTRAVKILKNRNCNNIILTYYFDTCTCRVINLELASHALALGLNVSKSSLIFVFFCLIYIILISNTA